MKQEQEHERTVAAPVPTSGSKIAEPRHSRQLSTENALLKPATPREIAVELEKLRSVFGHEARAWETAAGLYMDALADLPCDLLQAAVALYIKRATAADRFPKPGDLRAIIVDQLQARRARFIECQEDPAWPKWLEEIWGPSPEGPIARQGWIDGTYRSRDEAPSPGASPSAAP
jgi:hypothetical protein